MIGMAHREQFENINDILFLDLDVSYAAVLTL